MSLSFGPVHVTVHFRFPHWRLPSQLAGWPTTELEETSLPVTLISLLNRMLTTISSCKTWKERMTISTLISDIISQKGIGSKAESLFGALSRQTLIRIAQQTFQLWVSGFQQNIKNRHLNITKYLGRNRQNKARKEMTPYFRGRFSVEVTNPEVKKKLDPGKI